MARTLIKTSTAGWYLNSEDLDGNRVRKTDGDLILTRDEFDALAKQTNGTTPDADQAKSDKRLRERRESSEPVKLVKLDTGKEVPESQTTVITCSKKGCKNTRRIKKQDVFQVKFCVEDQKEHRKAIRREKLRAKRAAARAAKQAS